MSDNGWLPPDTQGAVGPNHIMTSTNGGVLIQNRQGQVLKSDTLDNWFSFLGFENYTFDPRVEYDPYSQRWIHVAMADADAPSSQMFIEVSKTSDPTGGWWGYKFDADAAGVSWADYPIVGFNKKWIVVQEQLFGGNPIFSRIFAFSKANMYAGQAVTHNVFNLPAGDGLWQAPADTYDPNLEDELLLQNYGTFEGDGWVRIYRLSGTVGQAQLSDNQWATVDPTWANNSAATNPAPQQGSATRINNGDARMQDLEYRNGSLWAAHQVFLPEAAASRTSVQWWEIAAPPAQQEFATVQQFGRVDDPAGQRYYSYPSIGVNKDDDVLLGYSRFSSTQFPSANYSFRAGTDPASTLGPDTVLKAGEGSYVDFDKVQRNRWGDYSATVVDPNNDTDLWTLQEYALPPTNATNGRWATWWGKISPDGTVTPPPNDDFANAYTLTGADTGRNNDSNQQATKQTGEPNHAGNSGGASVWYSWTAPASGEVTIDTVGSDFDTTLAAYTGATVGALTGVASNNDIDPGVERQSRVSFQATASTTYRIAVDGFNHLGAGAQTGSIDLHVHQDGGPAGPPNDDFANAQALTGADDTRENDTNVGATKQSAAGEPDHDGNPGGASVWYSWTAPGSGMVTIDTAGSDFDTLLAAYTGAGVGALSLVASDDDVDPGVDTTSEISFAATADTTYRIAVDGYNDQGAGADTGSIDLHLHQEGTEVSNDDFADAHTLTGTTASRENDTNQGATKQSAGGEPNHADNTGGASVWYRWMAPSSGPVTIDTSGSDFDTLLAAYTGTSVGALNEVGSNDDVDPGDDTTSEVSFAAVAGTTYQIAIDGYSRQGAAEPATGALDIHLGPGSAAPPDTFFTRHPRHRTHRRRATFKFGSDVGGASFECRYATGWDTCTSPERFTGLSPGRYNFKARAVSAGVKDPTPASWSWRVLR